MTRITKHIVKYLRFDLRLQSSNQIIDEMMHAVLVYFDFLNWRLGFGSFRNLCCTKAYEKFSYKAIIFRIAHQIVFFFYFAFILLFCYFAILDSDCRNIKIINIIIPVTILCIKIITFIHTHTHTHTHTHIHTYIYIYII